ncbi:MAG TPA: N-6 DNA methylase [Chloroflexia bacterium]|jgi:hypothetical protein
MNSRSTVTNNQNTPGSNEWDSALVTYLAEVGSLSKESARSHRFAMFLQQVLGLDTDFVESYSTGIEHYLKVKQKDRLLRGEADNLFGNIILEFESDIPKKLNEADEQLRRYTAILWSQETPGNRTPYIVIATDGIRFLAFTPHLLTISESVDIRPENIGLNLIEETDWSNLTGVEVFYWLDRYFLRKTILRPTSEAIVGDFGVNSHAFQTATRSLLVLWEQVKEHSSFSVVYESWNKYLRIVYGSDIAGDELFVRHTYLATLAKLMSWTHLSDNKSRPGDLQIIEMLEGQFFRRQGIENFIEEDFFSWLARGPAATIAAAVVRQLYSLLQNYDLRELSEDVLKSLYQELVDPETRHELGEFYTPDWLAERIVRKLLDTNPSGTILDPACGSGTFLYLAIRDKQSRFESRKETLYHILGSIFRADIHPLAVIVAKTNYILGLGDLLQHREGVITIPVYLADTLRLPEYEKRANLVPISDVLVQQQPGYRVVLEDQAIQLPAELVEENRLYDEGVELAREFAYRNRGTSSSTTIEGFRKFLQARQFAYLANEIYIQTFYAIAETLKHFIDIERDTIWAFVLKNIYKPLFFKNQFDFIVGNPPWIAFRFTDPIYQVFLKREITQGYRLLSKGSQNMPNLEIATLFLLRAADLYLKRGGRIAFVLPRSIFNADQHDGLRRRTFQLKEQVELNAQVQDTLFWEEVWDCEYVEPLFTVSCCVLLAQRERFESAETGAYTFPGKILTGKLPRKNASSTEAESTLTEQVVDYSLHLAGRRSFWAPRVAQSHVEMAGNYYKKLFQRGANFSPRTFWLVDLKRNRLGFNSNMPVIISQAASRTGPETKYANIRLEGNVEAKFLYCTALGDDIIPYGYRNLRLIVLPVVPTGTNYTLVTVEKAQENGFYGLAQWLAQVELLWQQNRGEKAANASAVEWLDYRKKLAVQNPLARYRVVYPSFQRVSFASFLDTEQVLDHVRRQTGIQVANFVVDTALYYAETDDRNEAMYLSAVLSSGVIDERLGELRRKLQKGHPNVHKKIFDVALIPKYSPDDMIHHQLAELADQCQRVVSTLTEGGHASITGDITGVRRRVRQLLSEQQATIDQLVRKLL